MMLIGQPLTAREAKESGILTRVVSRDKLDEEVEKVAEIVAKKPLDGIVMGKKEFGLAMDVMGLSTGYDLGSFAHTLVSNMKFEPGEFNLMKELRDKGRQGMYVERDAHYKDMPLRKE